MLIFIKQHENYFTGYIIINTYPNASSPFHSTGNYCCILKNKNEHLVVGVALFQKGVHVWLDNLCKVLIQSSVERYNNVIIKCWCLPNIMS